MCVWVRNSKIAVPVFVPTGGPSGRSAVVFDRTNLQHLDGGAVSMNIASNGGFTAVAVVRFTGSANAFERVLDFGKGFNNDNILISRLDMESRLGFAIRNGGSDCAIWSSSNVFTQDSWVTVVAMYRSSTRTMEIRVGSDIQRVVCTEARTDRTVSNTYVGKSNWSPQG